MWSDEFDDDVGCVVVVDPLEATPGPEDLPLHAARPSTTTVVANTAAAVRTRLSDARRSRGVVGMLSFMPVVVRRGR
jgi:hypothetical protein